MVTARSEPRGTVARTLALASVAGLCLLGPVGCSESEEPQAVTPAGGADGARASGGAAPADRPSTKIDPELLERLPSLKRVEVALEGPVMDLTELEAERLAELQAWVKEQRPDISDRDLALMSQMMLIMDRFMEAEDITLSDLKGFGESQLVQVWAMDKDGDGILSDEEAKNAMQSFEDMGPLMEARYGEELDTDGDGEVSPEERRVMEQRMQENMEPMMKTMIDRATLVAWDEDGDGVISDAEREAGEADLEMNDWDDDGEISGFERQAAYGPLLMEMNNGLMLLEMPDMAQISQDSQADTQKYMEEMRSIQTPDQSEFDLDGDGSYSDEEMAMWQAEVDVANARRQEIGQRMREAGENMFAEFQRAQWDAAVGALDSDGDGRLVAEEWAGNYDSLRRQRDQRMFNYLYDADRSGGVNDYEVARFMDAYESQSVYADADLNGVVDQQDLQYFVSQIGEQ